MVAFGGSGPLHALAVARKLKIPRVVFPVAAGVMSALGLLVAPLAFEVARSRRVHIEDIDAQDFAATFSALDDQATQILADAGVANSDMRVIRRLDMRYQGQGHEIEVGLPNATDPAAAFAELEELFGQAYQSNYGLRLDQPVEIINWKVEATAPASEFGDAYHLANSSASGSAQKGTRRAYDPDQDDMIDWPVYDRYALKPGMTVDGPALIEERESTCIVGTGDRVTVDARFNLIADLNLTNQAGSAK